MTLRSARELAEVDDPAWPVIRALVSQAGETVEVMAIDPARGEASLYALQVTAASVLGALSLECGGLLVDSGWLRILGGGGEGLASIAEANGLTDPSAPRDPLAHLVVAFDVLGGRFAVDGGGLGIGTGEVCYWAPDSLAWEGTGLGHGAFVQAFVGGAGTEFYRDLRWTGWAEEVAALALDQGISLWPPPFTVEGKDVAAASRRPIPFVELVAFYEEMAAQL